jgi:hypothetical protein
MAPPSTPLAESCLQKAVSKSVRNFAENMTDLEKAKAK